MNGYEYRIVVLVRKFDHFLYPLANTQAHQSGKFTDTVIHVNNIIAKPELIQFFECKGDFSRTSFVRLQAVFVETIKNLMIGKAAYFQGFVGETFVKGFIDGCKHNIFAPIFKDIAQSFLLFFAVTQDINGISLIQEMQHRFAQ